MQQSARSFERKRRTTLTDCIHVCSNPCLARIERISELESAAAERSEAKAGRRLGVARGDSQPLGAALGGASDAVQQRAELE